MSMLTRALRGGGERRFDAILSAVLAQQQQANSAGVAVTPETSLTYGAVWACVRVLSESVASLPFLTYRRLPRGGKERATDDPRYPLLHSSPNPEMTTSEWLEQQMANACLWGNSFSQIVRNGAGLPLSAWPQYSRSIEVKRTPEGKLYYHNTDVSAKTPNMSLEDVLHVRSLSLDGINGISPIAQARQAIGLGIATEKFGATFFRNGANPGIVLEHPGILDDEAYKRLQASWEARSGVDNAHKPVILEEGLKFEKLSIPNDDAQFLETRNFQVRDIARWFRVQPHLIGDLADATFSNIEHQGLDFLIHTLRPWLTRIEQRALITFFAPAERSTLFVEFLTDALLRGDTITRFNAYSIARQWGWMNSNEIRSLENMNPVEGGDEYMVPLNYAPLTSFGQAPAQTPATDSNQRLLIVTPLYRDVVGRIQRRLMRDVIELVRKHGAKEGGELEEALNRCISETHAAFQPAVLPTVNAHTMLRGKQFNQFQKLSSWLMEMLKDDLEWIRQTVDGARVMHIPIADAIEDQFKRMEDRIVERASYLASKIDSIAEDK